MFLYNRVNADLLRERIQNDPTPRTTLSFYRYVILENPQETRDFLYRAWAELGVLGRIYIAREGVNAQLSLPTNRLDDFRNWIDQYPHFAQVPFKIAVDDDGKSFFKLTIKVRKKIVADGLDDDAFDVTNVGNHLTAEEFNAAMDDPETIVVDMRNHYEAEVGRFEGAIVPDVDTFREELPWVVENLADQKTKVLMYCTGGIRCEKASAYLKHHGFKDVNQLHGGIIAYAQEIKAKGLDSKFKGKNFVFDERLGERITDDVIANCHQCGQPCDNHTNCANVDCNLLFIQCDNCKTHFANCCSEECHEIVLLPEAEQKNIRKGKSHPYVNMIYRKGRLRPHGHQLQNFTLNRAKNMNYNNILTEKADGIFTITINRPDKLNALNYETIQEIGLAVRLANDDDEVRGILLTGSGEKAFAAGADISEFAAFSRDEAEKLSRDGNRVFTSIEHSKKPVVAAINGFALGGGCELAMSCQIRVASETARFGQPEVNLGLTPGYAGTQRLVQLVGKGKALEFLMTADMIPAAEAHRLGLVNHVVPQAELISKAKEILTKIGTKAPLAIAAVIRCVNSHFAFDEDGFETEIREFAGCFQSEDFKEGTQAFLEKRKAIFKGA